jgi:hypothetical protein
MNLGYQQRYSLRRARGISSKQAMTKAEQDALRLNTAGSPPLASTTKSHLCAVTSIKTLRRFVALNSGAVRYSPTHRLWTSPDIYAAHQRSAFGGALVMMSVYRPDGSFSDPFICVTGPMAVPFLGEVYESRDAFNLTDGDPLPVLDGATRMPELLAAPTSMSVMASSRSWIEATAPSQLLLQARTKPNILTVFDSQSLHSTIAILDVSDHLHQRLAKETDVRTAGLWVPAVPSELSPAGDPTPKPDILRANMREATVPPDPKTFPVWCRHSAEKVQDKNATRNLSLSRPSDTVYKPVMEQAVSLLRHPDHTKQPGINPGFMLLPRFLRFPTAAVLPVGMVMKTGITVENFRAIITTISDGDTDNETKWANNAILDAWLEAAATNPQAFVVPVFPHEYFLSAFPPSVPARALSIRLHQEWSILGQLLWDNAFAQAGGRQDEKMLSRLGAYACGLVSANNIGGDTALSNRWGIFSSIYRMPLLARLRQPDAESMAILGGKWTVFTDALDSDLPAYMLDAPCRSVPFPAIGDDKWACVSIRNTLTEDEILEPTNLDPTPPSSPPPGEDPLLAFGRRSPRSHISAFACTPDAAAPPKRVRLHLPDKSRPPTPERSLSPVEEDFPFDPVALAACPVSNPAEQDPWFLPYHALGQTSLPGRTAATSHSQAQATAIRQASIRSTSSQDEKTSGFEFSLDFMLGSSHPTRDVTHRITFWGSF